MARKRRNKKLAPTELTMYFAFPPNSAGNAFVDLGQCLSQMNRKAFRQGYQYVVAGTELIGSSPADIYIHRLPHHWPAVNSWTKTMKLWLKQQNEKMDDAGLDDTVARYRDFKIYANGAHADAGVTANLQPLPSFITPGAGNGEYLSVADAQVISPTVTMDWDMSQIVIPNVGGAGTPSVEYFCHLLGDDDFTGAVNSFWYD